MFKYPWPTGQPLQTADPLARFSRNTQKVSIMAWCEDYYNGCKCKTCRRNLRAATREAREEAGTFNSTAFADKPQRSDPSVTNTYFNAGKVDGDAHGHVKYRTNPDGTTNYLYVRDVEDNEYDV